jgi:hypothetical protein
MQEGDPMPAVPPCALFVATLILWAATGLAAAASTPAVEPVVRVEDVTRFYALYDASGGHPGAEQLQHDYLDPGSEGLHRFAQAGISRAQPSRRPCSETRRFMQTRGAVPP